MWPLHIEPVSLDSLEIQWFELILENSSRNSLRYTLKQDTVFGTFCCILVIHTYSGGY